MTIEELAAKAAIPLKRLRATPEGLSIAIGYADLTAILAYLNALEKGRAKVTSGVDLEIPCPDHEGDSCQVCDGSGVVPTDEGQRLLDFVSKYLAE